VLLLLAIEGVAALLRVRAAALSDEELGRVAGGLLVSPLPALVLAAIGSRSLRRRRAGQAAGAGKGLSLGR
jgi:hypothetical protein